VVHQQTGHAPAVPLHNIGAMLGRSAWQRRVLFTQSVPINSVTEAPDALDDYGFRNSSGSLATFAAIRRASSRVSNPGLLS
jgi:hypothetical protein